MVGPGGVGPSSEGGGAQTYFMHTFTISNVSQKKISFLMFLKKILFLIKNTICVS
jgi:hypothetical protein